MSTKPFDPAAAVAFLNSLPGDRIHLTAIDPNTGKIVGQSFPKVIAGTGGTSSGLTPAECIRRAVKSGRGLYFNINGLSVELNTRTHPKADETEVDTLNGFHVDADVDKSITDPAAFEIAKADLLERIKTNSPQPPSFVIDSGNGFGVFWLLARPVKVTDANRDLFKRINVALRDAIGGADSCQNLDRVMRVPYTYNFPNAAKRKRGRPVSWTRVVLDDRDLAEYCVEDFEPAPAGAADEAEPQTEAIDIPNSVDFDRINDPAFIDRLKNGWKQGYRPGDKSQSDFTYAMACEMRRAGFTDGEIVWTITNPDFDVADHILRQKQRDHVRQARRTIERMDKDGVIAEPSAIEAFADDPITDAALNTRIVFDVQRDAQRRHKAPGIGHNSHGLVLINASTVNPRNVNFIWPLRLARGKHTAMAGEGGKGKSQLAYDIAARITKASDWPDDGKAPLGTVLILSAEDGREDAIVPRLIAAGAVLTNVEIIKATKTGDGGERKFNLQDDLVALRNVCEDLNKRHGKPPVMLIIIDPVSSYMGGDIDTHRNTAVRHVLDPLTQLAEDVQCAVLSITHFNKGTSAKAVHRVMESAAFTNAPRAAFGVFDDADDGIDDFSEVEHRLFLPLKTNIGKKARGWRYHIEEAQGGTDDTTGQPVITSRIAWDGPTDLTADQVAQMESERGQPRLDSATTFLTEYLADGPKPAKQVRQEADARGITEGTLRRAREKLGITSETVKGKPQGGNEWSLGPNVIRFPGTYKPHNDDGGEDVDPDDFA